MTRDFAAGLFEGEGYAAVIRHSQPNTWSPVMSLTMTSFEMVQRLHAFFGVGSLYEEKPRKAHHLPALRWAARHRHALHAASQIVDLCICKKAALQSIVDYYANYEPPEHVYKKGHVGPTAVLSEEDVRDIRLSKEPGKVLAARYGLSAHAISNARTGKTWGHVL